MTSWTVPTSPFSRKLPKFRNDTGFVVTATIWLIIAMALLVSEFFVPGLILLFFGLAALLVTGAVALGWLVSLGGQLTAFGVLSVCMLVLLRRILQNWLQGRVSDEALENDPDSSLVGKHVIVAEDFANKRGKVILNGVRWAAISEQDLKAGETARIVKSQSTDLIVEPT